MQLYIVHVFMHAMYVFLHIKIVRSKCFKSEMNTINENSSLNYGKIDYIQMNML